MFFFFFFVLFCIVISATASYFFFCFFLNIRIVLTILLFFCSFGWQRDFSNGKLTFFVQCQSSYRFSFLCTVPFSYLFLRLGNNSPFCHMRSNHIILTI